jgi:hypothetical protein
METPTTPVERANDWVQCLKSKLLARKALRWASQSHLHKFNDNSTKIMEKEISSRISIILSVIENGCRYSFSEMRPIYVSCGVVPCLVQLLQSNRINEIMEAVVLIRIFSDEPNIKKTFLIEGVIPALVSRLKLSPNHLVEICISDTISMLLEGSGDELKVACISAGIIHELVQLTLSKNSKEVDVANMILTSLIKGPTWCKRECVKGGIVQALISHILSAKRELKRTQATWIINMIATSGDEECANIVKKEIEKVWDKIQEIDMPKNEYTIGVFNKILGISDVYPTTGVSDWSDY